MFIGIDGNEANVKNRVGSNVYAFQLLKYFYSQLENRDDLKFRIYLKSNTVSDMPKPKINWEYHVFGPKPLWTQFALPKKLYFEKMKKTVPDIFFTPGHYAPKFSPIPNTIAIMDLAFLKFDQEFLKKDLIKLKKWTKLSAQKAEHIFTISNYSKNDIIKNYQVKNTDITITYPGDGLKKNPQASDRSYQNLAIFKNIKKPYILYLGTLQPRKNLKRLIKAFASLLKKNTNSNLNLVLAGKKGWLYKELFETVKKLKLENKVIFTGFISEFEKYELLRHSHIFVLPSLYEGFGIPVLEAMNAETPVLASLVSSIPEVGGDSISYIKNPENLDDIEKSIEKMLQLTDSQRKKIIFAQKKQAAKFSWETCGKITLEKLINLK